ncbi:hypothetical protein [Xanthomonas axonopodis]|uniref:hypothetical protein n=1 Tax=Xanthomonas axonopodis TaxID=53413 RepID=UPI003556DC43
MNVASLCRLLMWAVVLGFFADVARRCLVVQALSLLPFAAAAVCFALLQVRAAWRASKHTQLSVNGAASDFPEQSRRGVR